MKKTDVAHPWYKEFWLWVVIGLPACVVVGCLFTVSIAFNNADTVVNDDLQGRGLTAEAQLEEEVHARQLGISALVSISREKGDIRLSLSHVKPLTLPSTLTLTLSHPTLPELDEHIALNQVGEGKYEGALLKFYSGKRYFSLLPEKGGWELKGKVVLFTDKPQKVG